MSATARTYVVALAVLVFTLTWAAVAARPWQAASADPRAAALDRREERLRREAADVQALLAARLAEARAAAAGRRLAAPAVRVVALPPVASTRTS